MCISYTYTTPIMFLPYILQNISTGVQKTQFTEKKLLQQFIYVVFGSFTRDGEGIYEFCNDPIES